MTPNLETTPPGRSLHPVPALLGSLALLGLTVAPGVLHAQVEVTRARPGSVTLEAGNATPATILLEGRGLANVVGAGVLSGGRTLRGVNAKVEMERRGLRIDLVASARARPAKGTLLLLLENRRRMAVDAVTVVVEEPSAPPFEPRRVSARQLSMAGVRFRPPSVDATPLAMAGVGFAPATVEAARLAMTGVAFRPVALEVRQLALSGVRFAPLRFATPPLRMQGTRSER